MASGRHLKLEEFRAMTEKEQFAHVFVSVKAISHLDEAATTAPQQVERARSKFGAYNLRKNLEIGRGEYDEAVT